MGTILLGIANFLAELLGIVGLLVFGFSVSWLLVSTLRQNDKPWQLVATLFFVFFAFTAVVIWRTAPGDLGAFTLGAGGGVLYWGYIRPNRKAVLPPEDEQTNISDDKPKI